jgi:excisionase family DNA binding protein
MRKKRELPKVDVKTEQMLTLPEVQAILRISKSHSYKLVHTAGFPVVRVSAHSYRVPHSALMKWIERRSRSAA